MLSLQEKHEVITVTHLACEKGFSASLRMVCVFKSAFVFPSPFNFYPHECIIHCTQAVFEQEINVMNFL